MPQKETIVHARHRARIGTSGWQYEHWRGLFYPPAINRRDWFRFYADRFDTVEINNTFYNLPSESVFDSWRARAPENFLFALKFSRYGSHYRRLLEPQASIDAFVDRARRLEEHLGPILVQLPPRWKADAIRLSAFLDAAPSTMRWAVEFRDPSWLCEPVYEVLRSHGAALCIHDMIQDHPRVVTTSWTYLRFHGTHHAGDYDRRSLTVEAGRIGGLLEQGLDVYAYFNNDGGGHALHNAEDLREMTPARMDEKSGEQSRTEPRLRFGG